MFESRMGARISDLIPNSDVHANGKFEEWQCCSCPSDHWMAKRMSKQRSKLMTPGLVTKLVGGVVNHDHVLVEFECKACGHEFGVTLEFCEDGTSMIVGRHTNLVRIVKSIDLDLTFAEVKEIYTQCTHTSEEYNLVMFNCKNYAVEIWRKLKKANSNRNGNDMLQ
ncbi:hypothetical protein M3Y95_00774600 [Aphelenchoides besseyi]|nr:hypothetical protein M3Y95_00774600 [Aphelenchoides besseyi]